VKILILAVGSAGDVHPFVPIARGLAERGHEVILLANEVFRERIEAVPGVAFAAAGDAETYRRTTSDPDLFHPRRGAELIFRTLAENLEMGVELLREHVDPGRTVIVGSSLTFSARLVQEADGVPLVTVHLQPGVLRSVYDMPRMPTGNLPAWAPVWLRRLYWWLADRFLDGLLQPELDREAARLGLPPVRRVLDRWWHSPELAIGLFAEWYGPRQPDWPAQLVLTGFPLFDAGAETPLDPELDAWLSDGTPPLVFTAGSAQHHAGEFFARSVEACRLLGRRALLVSPAPETIPRELPAGVVHRSYVPFGAVFPRAAVLVHHGGIGTTAQALAAALPQLVVPWAHDQFDNGARVARLGVGAMLTERRYRPARAARVLGELAGSEAVAARCRELARRMSEGDPVAESCRLIEGLADRL